MVQTVVDVMPEVQQHDHKEKEDHDGAGIDDYLNRGYKGCVQEHKEPRQTHEREDKVDRAGDGVPLEHQHDRSHDRHGREEVKERGH